jgi:hypothetical protein
MSRAGKWVLGSCLGMAALLGLAVVLLHRKAMSAIHAQEVAVAALLSELQIHAPPRPAIFGGPLPGRGWDLYIQAAAMIDALPDDDREAIREISSSLIDPDDAAIATAWTHSAPIVDMLRRAVRSADQSREPARSAAIAHGKLENMSGLLRGGAAHLHRIGRDGEAFEILTLRLAVCRDTLGRNDGGCGWSPETDEETASTGLKFLGDHTLSAQDLEDLAFRLARIDEVRPSAAREYRLRDAFERRHALEGEIQGWEEQRKPLQAGWRELFLPSVAQAAVLAEIEDAYRAFGDVERLPAIEREAAAEGLGPPWRRGRAPGTCIIPSNNLYYAEISALQALTLLRVGVALAWFQVEHGPGPARLDELVPRYLPNLPPQYSADQPWRYSAEDSSIHEFYGRDWEIQRRGD